jgi:hypothetical protein
MKIELDKDEESSHPEVMDYKISKSYFHGENDSSMDSHYVIKKQY